MTKIEWTEKTWNPIVGCSVVSPGCTNCYAMKLAPKLAANPATPHYAGTVESSRAGPVWTGKVALASDDALTAPLRRRKPTMYFVSSMGDLFHEAVPDEWIDRVFAVMALAPQHTFQVLTKRAARMRAYITDREDREIGRAQDRQLTGPHPVPVLPNVWLGVSAEDQTRADERIPDLLATPAAVRFVSCEPLLGPVDLTSIPGTSEDEDGKLDVWWDVLTGVAYDEWGTELSAQHWQDTGLDWVIVGGESGRGARPMHPDWPRAIRDQCAAAGVPFFFKQWGEWLPFCQMDDPQGEALYFPQTEEEEARELDRKCRHDSVCIHLDGTHASTGDAGRFHHIGVGAFNQPRDVSSFRVGKAAAGRLLDGREWNGMPEVAA
ncbi:phage Gp37/Gp68 family protein [Roseibacterium beibuensis]|uniref:Phage Gp37/Gp68 family protein n=1 Tax=[Roseibacterium] beibuensis TaxID=1193142 RepID=A0ABP9LCW9_9RHOB|nr:phage Gp37/Gp68 family protein [Roseibacterium beibuensis]MCS6624378.1 phage Gp37/Gp68 family protein [Roseibacterium beibuensis]